MLFLKSPIVTISLKSPDKMSIPSFDVMDDDAPPFDNFNCVVENNLDFAILNNNKNKKVIE